MKTIQQQLSFFNQKLIDELLLNSTVRVFSKGTEIIKQEHFIKVVPIVISGLVKVFSKFKEKELLLYYIQPKQSCIMSFSASLNNTPSRIFAITEEDSEIILIPTKSLPNLLREYPELNELFYNQYDLRYAELLDTIQHILIDKMDKRLHDYLKDKIAVTSNETIKITHGQIANELGTSREVISRVIKKLEIEGKVAQNSDGIKILEL